MRVEEQEETLVKHKHTTELPHVFAHARDTELSPCVYKTWQNLSSTSHDYLFVISWPSLPQLSDHIFEILQDLTVAEDPVVTHRQTDRQRDRHTNQLL